MALFGRLFGQRKPAAAARPRTLPLGHRGVGIGSTSAPDLSAENITHWKLMPGEEAWDFVYDAQPMVPHSTSIAVAVYQLAEEQLHIEYKSGHRGYYEGVTEAEAVALTQAMSKGSWVIDNCIGRENLKGHACWHGGPSKKNWVKLN